MRDLIQNCLQNVLDQLNANDAASEEAQRAAREALIRKRLERLDESGVPLSASDKQRIAAGTLDRTHCLRVVQAWHAVFTGTRKAERCPHVTALLGQTGRGKTLAAAWLIAEEGGVYVSALELRTRLLSRFGRDPEWAERVLRSRIVVLDDVGTEVGDGEASAAVFELVNKRAGLDRALTLITGNICASEFIVRYGERTARRIEHDGIFIEAKGADLRRKPTAPPFARFDEPRPEF